MGDGWVTEAHFGAFTRAAQDLIADGPAIANKNQGSRKQPANLILVERALESAWGRWIDNFDKVRAATDSFRNQLLELIGSVDSLDFAQLSVPEQLRKILSTRLLFGAHGDGLSWTVFMGDGAGLLEAVPGRRQGFQACREG